MHYTVESIEQEWVISVEGEPLMRCAVTEAAFESMLQLLELLRAPLCSEKLNIGGIDICAVKSLSEKLRSKALGRNRAISAHRQIVIVAPRSYHVAGDFLH